jgi:hypothetical protein
MIKKSVDMPKEQAYRWDRHPAFRGVGGAHRGPEALGSEKEARHEACIHRE